MAMYVCKNRGNCSKADSQEPVDIAFGAADKCLECSMTMKPVAGTKQDSSQTTGTTGASDGTDTGGGKQLIIIVATAVIAIAAIGSAGYAFRCKIPMLGERVCKGTVVTSSPTPAPQPKPSKPGSQAPEGPALMNCEQAVETKNPDRLRICNRANAITLTNSGGLAATDGKLDDAERDYKAAIAKDPGFEGVYVNYAALKVRQVKYAEAIHLIEKVLQNGAGQADLIEQDPVFKPLFNDAVYGKQLKKMISVAREGQGSAASPVSRP